MRSFLCYLVGIGALITWANAAETKHKLSWKVQYLFPDGEQTEITLESSEKKFYLPKTKWSCSASSVAEDATQISGSSVKRFKREIKCVNLRDKDEVNLPIVCFDLPEQLEESTFSLTDEKKQIFKFSLICSSV